MITSSASEGFPVDTLGRLFLRAVRQNPRPDLMFFKQGGRFRNLSTEDFSREVEWLSLALRKLGHKRGDKLILLLENGPQWMITDLANLCMGGVTVPVYTTLPPEQIRHIIENSDAGIVAASGREQWAKLDSLKSLLPKVRTYISLDPDPVAGAVSLHELRDIGKTIAEVRPGLFERDLLSIRPDDLASIIYTSGTTGIPKGVMLTHANFVGNAVTVTGLLELAEGEIGFSFLPLSHVFERTVTFGYLYRGCRIAFAESIETVADDLLEIRPHLFACVPRLLEKIYTRVTENILSGPLLKRRLFKWAVENGRIFSREQIAGRAIPAWLKIKNKLAGKLVFSKILTRLGGRVRLCVSAAAPLSREIAEFFHAVGLRVLEGYGMTETSPGIAVNTLKNLKLGSVGRPIDGVQVRLAEDGEILVRGPNVMRGYYKDPAATEEVLVGGWLHTGDIGVLDEDGYLTITDRKKDLIITSGGKNTAPQPTELLLRMSPYIANAVVIGDRRKYLSALIVPQFEKLMEYARKNRIKFQEIKDLVKNSAVIRFIESEVEKHTASLARFEKIKRIALLDREFELEAGEITPTLKIKRNIITQKYSALIESLYAD